MTRRIEPNQFHWPVTQGTDWTLRYRVTRDGEMVPDFLSYTLTGQAREWPNRDAPLVAEFEFDLTEGDGWVTQRVARALTAAVKPDEYPFQVFWQAPGTGAPLLPLFGGTLAVGPQIVVEVPQP